MVSVPSKGLNPEPEAIPSRANVFNGVAPIASPAMRPKLPRLMPMLTRLGFNATLFRIVPFINSPVIPPTFVLPRITALEKHLSIVPEFVLDPTVPAIPPMKLPSASLTGGPSLITGCPVMMPVV
jgi:hypothetical protein